MINFVRHLKLTGNISAALALAVNDIRRGFAFWVPLQPSFLRGAWNAANEIYSFIRTVKEAELGVRGGEGQRYRTAMVWPATMGFLCLTLASISIIIGLAFGTLFQPVVMLPYYLGVIAWLGGIFAYGATLSLKTPLRLKGFSWKDLLYGALRFSAYRTIMELPGKIDRWFLDTAEELKPRILHICDFEHEPRAYKVIRKAKDEKKTTEPEERNIAINIDKQNVEIKVKVVQLMDTPLIWQGKDYKGNRIANDAHLDIETDTIYIAEGAYVYEGLADVLIKQRAYMLYRWRQKVSSTPQQKLSIPQKRKLMAWQEKNQDNARKFGSDEYRKAKEECKSKDGFTDKQIRERAWEPSKYDIEDLFSSKDFTKEEQGMMIAGDPSNWNEEKKEGIEKKLSIILTEEDFGLIESDAWDEEEKRQIIEGKLQLLFELSESELDMLRLNSEETEKLYENRETGDERKIIVEKLRSGLTEEPDKEKIIERVKKNIYDKIDERFTEDELKTLETTERIEGARKAIVKKIEAHFTRAELEMLKHGAETKEKRRKVVNRLAAALTEDELEALRLANRPKGELDDIVDKRNALRFRALAATDKELNALIKGEGTEKERDRVVSRLKASLTEKDRRKLRLAEGTEDERRKIVDGLNVVRVRALPVSEEELQMLIEGTANKQERGKIIEKLKIMLTDDEREVLKSAAGSRARRERIIDRLRPDNIERVMRYEKDGSGRRDIAPGSVGYVEKGRAAQENRPGQKSFFEEPIVDIDTFIDSLEAYMGELIIEEEGQGEESSNEDLRQVIKNKFLEKTEEGVAKVKLPALEEYVEKLALNGRLCLWFMFGGSATRLGLDAMYFVRILKHVAVGLIEAYTQTEEEGRTPNEEQKRLLASFEKSVKDEVARETIIKRLKGLLKDNELEWDYGMGPTQLVAYRIWLERLAKKCGKDPKAVVGKAPIIVHVNAETRERVARDLINKNFYGFNPDKICLIASPVIHGARLIPREGGVGAIKARDNPDVSYDLELEEFSDRFAVGHGEAMEQVKRINQYYKFVRDKSGEYDIGLQEKAVVDALESEKVKIIQQNRINDLMTWVGEGEEGREAASIHKLMYFISQGEDIGMELMSNPKRQKGGAFDELSEYMSRALGYQAQKKSLVEKLAAVSDFLKQHTIDAGDQGWPYNRMGSPYSVKGLRQILSAYPRLPRYLKYNGGLFYTDAVTGDVSQTPNATSCAYTWSPTIEINDFKEPKNAEAALKAIIRFIELLDNHVGEENREKWLTVMPQEGTEEGPEMSYPGKVKPSQFDKEKFPEVEHVEKLTPDISLKAIVEGEEIIFAYEADTEDKLSAEEEDVLKDSLKSWFATLEGAPPEQIPIFVSYNLDDAADFRKDRIEINRTLFTVLFNKVLGLDAGQLFLDGVVWHEGYHFLNPTASEAAVRQATIEYLKTRQDTLVATIKVLTPENRNSIGATEAWYNLLQQAYYDSISPKIAKVRRGMRSLILAIVIGTGMGAYVYMLLTGTRIPVDFKIVTAGIADFVDVLFIVGLAALATALSAKSDTGRAGSAGAGETPGETGDGDELSREEILIRRLKEADTVQAVQEALLDKIRYEEMLINSFKEDLPKELGYVRPVSADFAEACFNEMFSDDHKLQHRLKLYDEIFDLWHIFLEAKATKEKREPSLKNAQTYFVIVNDADRAVAKKDEATGEYAIEGDCTQVLFATSDRKGSEKNITTKMDTFYYRRWDCVANFKDIALSLYQLQQSDESKEALSNDSRDKLLASYGADGENKFVVIDSENTRRDFQRALAVCDEKLPGIHKCGSNGVPGGIWDGIMFNYTDAEEIYLEQAMNARSYKIGRWWHTVGEERIHAESIIMPYIYDYARKEALAQRRDLRTEYNERKNIAREAYEGITFEKGSMSAASQIAEQAAVYSRIADNTRKAGRSWEAPAFMAKWMTRVAAILGKGYKIEETEVDYEKEKLAISVSRIKGEPGFGDKNLIDTIFNAVTEKVDCYRYTAKFALWQWLNQEYPRGEAGNRSEKGQVAEEIVCEICTRLLKKERTIAGIDAIAEQARKEDKDIIVVSREIIVEDDIVQKFMEYGATDNKSGVKAFVSCVGSAGQHAGTVISSTGAFLLTQLPEAVFVESVKTGESASIYTSDTGFESYFYAGPLSSEDGLSMFKEVMVSNALKKYYLKREQDRAGSGASVARTMSQNGKKGLSIPVHGNVNLPLNLERGEYGIFEEGALGKIRAIYYAGGAGITLGRTEYMFDGAKEPDPDVQYRLYRGIADVANKPVTLRTFDKRDDKECASLPSPSEGNKYGFKYYTETKPGRDALKRQLKAMFKAYAKSKYKNLQIMFPMVELMEHTVFMKSILNEAKDEVCAENQDIDRNTLDELPVGIMVERAALFGSYENGVWKENETLEAILDNPHVKISFVSIGTNDLISNAKRKARYKVTNDDFDAQIMDFIERVVRECAKRKISVTICGDVARFTKTMMFGVYLYKKYGIPLIPGLIYDMIPKMKTLLEFCDANKCVSLLDPWVAERENPNIDEIINGIVRQETEMIMGRIRKRPEVSKLLLAEMRARPSDAHRPPHAFRAVSGLSAIFLGGGVDWITLFGAVIPAGIAYYITAEWYNLTSLGAATGVILAIISLIFAVTSFIRVRDSVKAIRKAHPEFTLWQAARHNIGDDHKALAILKKDSPYTHTQILRHEASKIHFLGGFLPFIPGPKAIVNMVQELIKMLEKLTKPASTRALEKKVKTASFIIGVVGADEGTVREVDSDTKYIKLISLDGADERANLKKLEDARIAYGAYASGLIETDITEGIKLRNVIEQLVSAMEKEDRKLFALANPEIAKLTPKTIEKITDIEQILSKIIERIPAIRSMKTSELSIYELRIDRIAKAHQVTSRDAQIAQKLAKIKESGGTKVASFGAHNIAELRWLANEHREALRKYGKENYPVELHIRLVDENVTEENLDKVLELAGVSDVITRDNITLADGETLREIYDLIQGQFGKVEAKNVAIGDMRDLKLDKELLKDMLYVSMPASAEGIVSQLYPVVVELIANDNRRPRLVPQGVGALEQPRGGLYYFIFTPVKPINMEELKHEVEQYKKILMAA